MLPPTDEQLSSNPNPDPFFPNTDIPIDDGSVQYSLLPGTGISSPSDDLFALNGGDLTPGGEVAYQDDLVASNGGDASWFQG